MSGVSMDALRWGFRFRPTRPGAHFSYLRRKIQWPPFRGAGHSLKFDVCKVGSPGFTRVATEPQRLVYWEGPQAKTGLIKTLLHFPDDFGNDHNGLDFQDGTCEQEQTSPAALFRLQVPPNDPGLHIAIQMIHTPYKIPVGTTLQVAMLQAVLQCGLRQEVLASEVHESNNSLVWPEASRDLPYPFQNYGIRLIPTAQILILLIHSIQERALPT
nr:protein NTM1-like 9 isoform X2 [Ipomoea batatas]